ncbi:MAG: hypothetical protein OdinLCB4_003845 [Candidatus Odinarchaeum yellowstonii]|uniref:Uncharacterized protein n=1 Tax=Odinarchaeota yellowstonii (strain LCB_4) TaxID=1841599 RepID=A0AAF0IDT8_ODILC|nr:MAG: hypothetical protein OdinLCB4_003845 [Candidatus Odinarchaeum yellowstonii]
MTRSFKMLEKLKKRFSGIRLKLPEAPSKTFWFIIILFFIYFILAGGIYDIVRQPITIGQSSSGTPILIFSASLGGGIDEQFILEGLAASMLMFLGFIGFMSIYESSKNIYNPSYAYTLIIVGLALIIIAFAGLQALSIIKLS